MTDREINEEITSIYGRGAFFKYQENDNRRHSSIVLIYSIVKYPVSLLSCYYLFKFGKSFFLKKK